MFILFQIIVGYLYATWIEWVIHKYILHGLGKNKNSWFNFHWYSHHKACRKNKYIDENYGSFLSSPVLKEITGLFFLVVIHTPTYFVMPYLYYTLAFCTLRYFYVHQKSHLNVDWAKVYLPWHYDHHMGKNQDANWGVTTALWDIILGTREK
jgi:hypothetical protein